MCNGTSGKDELLTSIFQWANTQIEGWRAMGITPVVKDPVYLGYPKTAGSISLDSTEMFSDVTVWDTGECDWTLLDVRSEEAVEIGTRTFTNAQDAIQHIEQIASRVAAWPKSA